MGYSQDVHFQVRKGNQTLGSFTREEVANKVFAGELADTDQVQDTNGRWMAIAEFAEHDFETTEPARKLPVEPPVHPPTPPTTIPQLPLIAMVAGLALLLLVVLVLLLRPSDKPAIIVVNPTPVATPVAPPGATTPHPATGPTSTSPPPAPPSPPLEPVKLSREEALERFQPATVLIEATIPKSDGGNDIIPIGTGWIADNNVVVTTANVGDYAEFLRSDGSGIVVRHQRDRTIPVQAVALHPRYPVKTSTAEQKHYNAAKLVLAEKLADSDVVNASTTTPKFESKLYLIGWHQPSEAGPNLDQIRIQCQVWNASIDKQADTQASSLQVSASLPATPTNRATPPEWEGALVIDESGNAIGTLSLRGKENLVISARILNEISLPSR